ncbi:hypothetical protein [Demequina activiva]|uniref:hypothetical protein n=1 Tax=Demequina activiva TaxID=1582364 RepID=UPI0019423BFC|nr:hypothetical protein [Demequina activiva]
MSLLRTVVSALCVLAGAFLIASWAVSSVVVTSVEDGTALRGITERALESPAVRSLVAERMTDRAVAAFADAGVDANGPVVRTALESGIAAAVGTEAFKTSVLSEVEAAHGQFSEQLTDSLREPAPLVLDVDVSDTINARLDEIPVVGEAIPDVSVSTVSVEVLSAGTFEVTRDTYRQIEWAAQWGLWAGIALLLVGILVSQRRRWFVAKLLLALGLICLLFGGAIALLGPDTIITFIPGGTDGPLSTIWRDIITEETAPLVMERSLWVAGFAFAGALVAMLLGAMLGGRRR